MYSKVFSHSPVIIRCIRCDIMACPKCHENDTFPKHCHYLCDECENIVKCQMGIDSIEMIHLIKRAGDEKPKKYPVLKKPGDPEIEEKEEEKDNEVEEVDLEVEDTFAKKMLETQEKPAPKQMGGIKTP